MRKICIVENCGRTHDSLGYCCAHYKRVLKHGHPQLDKPIGYRSKLNVNAATDIRTRYEKGERISDLAREYKVTRWTVDLTIKGQIYK